ncbi:MAG: polyketide synthase [Spirochaetia bacterium]
MNDSIIEQQDLGITRWTLKASGVAELEMCDTERRNQFTDEFIDSFIRCLGEIEKHSPHALIVSGLDDVFSGGADKQTLLDLCDGKVAVKDLEISERLIALPFPVIAAMKGHAIGGGLAIGLCSDMMILARESRYGAVFMDLGFTPGMGTTELLPLAFGPYLASEMMLGAKLFRGSELADRGAQVNAIVPKSEVHRRAMHIALQISEKPIKSVYLLKYSLTVDKRKRLLEARRNEDLMHRITFNLPETRELIDDRYNS